jgi:hypothetical protein
MKIRKLLWLCSMVLCFYNTTAQIAIPNTTTITQNFDGIGVTGTATLPTGIRVNTTANYTTGTSATTLAYGTTGANAVTGTSGGAIVNWANGVRDSSTDRAVGFLTSGSFSSPRTIVAAIQNTGTTAITSLTITFDYEKYRSGTRAFDFTFTHGSNATAVNTASASGDHAFAVDADNTTIYNPPLTFSKTINLTGLNIPASGMYYLCWKYTGVGGSSNAQGLGLDNLTITAAFEVLGIESIATGNWSNPATWQGGNVPDSNESAVIKTGHTVTMDDATYATRDSSTLTTVETGGTLVLNTTGYNNSGITTVNGTLRMTNGSDVTGNDVVYGSASTLNFAHASGTTRTITAGQRFWPVVNPPFNVTVSANSPIQITTPVGVVGGTLGLAAALHLSTANVLTVYGIFSINAGGSVLAGNAPLYGAASTLRYNTGGTYGRGVEWSANGIGVIGVTPGYPNNVTVQGTTVLDYRNGATAGTKAMAGALNVPAGSVLDMSMGAVAAGGPLVVAGNATIVGTLILGVGANDDLKLNGNLTANGTFTANGRKVFFTNNGVTQNITSTAPSLTIPYLVYEPTPSGSGLVQVVGGTHLIISAPAAGNAITFSNGGDVLQIPNNAIVTIGTAGISNTIAGGGTFRGAGTASLTLLGTGSIGTIAFSGAAAQQSLGTLTLDRTPGAIACVMGSPLTIATTLQLTAGILDLDAQTMTINSAATISGGNASNYIIADNTAGGVLRKQFSALGSFTFPIGDKSGTMEYSPATFTLTAGTGMTATSYIGVSVTDIKHPNLEASTHFISRYWSITRAGTFTAPTYTFTGNYLPSDINGSETTSLAQQWNGTVWADGAALGGNTLSLTSSTLPTGINQVTGGFRDQEINIKVGTTNYLTGSTYGFGTVATGGSSSVTFIIENTGNASLQLNANPVVTGSGFTMTAPLFTSSIVVNGNGTLSVTLEFSPTTAGTYSGSITFVNNDSNETSYVINFTGNGSGSNQSDIFRITNSEPTTISSLVHGTIATATDGVEVWRFNLRDGGATLADADFLPTIMTAFTIAQSGGDAIGNWTETIEDIVLVDVATSTIISHGVVISNQMQFTGITVVALDGTQVELALRMTLKCPLGAGALDGDDFGFSISNPNVTFDPSGSGKNNFTAQATVNGRLALAVVASQLQYSSQPVTTGVGTPMTSVVLRAVDACGNLDLHYTAPIALTSTGTMNPVTPVNAVAGVATFSTITHTVVGTDINLIATSGALPSLGSTLFDISTVTILQPGDLAVLAVNTNTNPTGGSLAGTDLISFVCFRDLLPGTTLYITDNGYERQFANEWGGTEGVIALTRTTLLPKGTIVTIEATTPNITSGAHYNIYTCGAIDPNWNKSAIGGSGFNLNSDDDIWFMQGGVWTNSTTHHSTYTGNVLYGWSESGWDVAPGGPSGDTKWSTIYPSMECFKTIAPIGDGYVKFIDPDAVPFSNTTRGKFDWIALINNADNWVSYSNNADFTTNGYDYRGNCSQLVIASDLYSHGKWSGRKDTNWFDCENWDTLLVPDETVDVVIGLSDFTPHPIVDATAPFASYSNFIAKAKNLTLTDKKLEIVGSTINKLEVHGDLVIANTVNDGALDMNDANPATLDGELYLYGHWNNNKDNDAFDEGNGTVYFVGTTPQVINAVTPIGTESFYNVVLQNNFTTTISNDLLATGNLNVTTGKNLLVGIGDYVQVNAALTNNGTITISNNGQLIQIDEVDGNTGNYTGSRFEVERIAKNIKKYDYVYWSAPTEGFNLSGITGSMKYYWDTTAVNANGSQGNWINASGIMNKGQGYIVRAPNSLTSPTDVPIYFRGKPFNGAFTFPSTRGTNSGSTNDNLVLLGNPYPSALDADVFLDVNDALIEGAVRLWMHGLSPSEDVDSPFYQNFTYNYSENDYLVYNGTASTIPGFFEGKIASGQGFFVTLLETGGATKNIQFSNAMRGNSISGILNNSHFFRTTSGQTEEKHRIWLDILDASNALGRTAVVGYVPNATMDKDNRYDAYATLDVHLNLYSLIDSEKMQIQGRALPFVETDQVPLGIYSPSNGMYTIALRHADGVFDQEQGVYLEDKALEVVHDLKQAPYRFYSQEGQDNSRFVLRYTTQALGIEQPVSLDKAVVAFSNQGQLTVNSNLENIKQVIVYDVLGRTLLTKTGVGNKVWSTNALTAQNATLLLHITLENGFTVVRKVMLQ